MNAWAQAEMERALANLLRVGVVTEVDAAKGVAKVRVGGLETDWIPCGTARAGGTRTGSAPTAGEQRLVFAPYGDVAQSVIGPAIYQDAHPTPAANGDQDVVVFPDGTRVEYDSAANKLQIDVGGAGLVVVNCKQATVKADTKVTLDTPETEVTGDLKVAGNVTVDGSSVKHGGKEIGKTHTHNGVQPGSGVSGQVT